MSRLLKRGTLVMTVTVTALAAAGAPSRATDAVVGFTGALFELDELPDEVDSGILVIITGGFTPYEEKRWLAWSSADGPAFTVYATKMPTGELDVRLSSADPTVFRDFFEAAEELGAFELADRVDVPSGSFYVTDLPTYRIRVRAGKLTNAFSVRNPAAADDKRYSELVKAIIDYFERD